MAYTVINFKTKKALKECVTRYHEEMNDNDIRGHAERHIVRCYQPGLGPDFSNFTGKVCLEGPHYSAAHTWYAEAELKDGIVIKVS